MRQALQASLAESPPPTLESLAARHDFDKSRAWKHCPELCRALTTRHRDDRQQQRAELAQKMETALLEETPPPTIATLAVRLHCCTASLRFRFPDLCHEIAARRSADERKERQNRQAQLLQDIQTAVTNLHAQGVYPSVNQVSAHLPKPVSLTHNPQALATIAQLRKKLGCE